MISWWLLERYFLFILKILLGEMKGSNSKGKFQINIKTESIGGLCKGSNENVGFHRDGKFLDKVKSNQLFKKDVSSFHYNILCKFRLQKRYPFDFST